MVYFLQCDNKDGFIKIGRTSGRVRVRWMSIQSACPYILNLIGVIDNEDLNGQPFALESSLHTLFAHACIGGEWFKPVPELLDYIAQHATMPTPADNVRWPDKRLLYSKNKTIRRAASLSHSSQTSHSACWCSSSASGSE